MYCRLCGLRLVGNAEEGYKHLDDDGRIIYKKHTPKPDRKRGDVRNHWSDS